MYLFLFHRLENLDYALLVVQYVQTLKDFTVFASANLSDDFIIVLIPKMNGLSELHSVPLFVTLQVLSPPFY